MNMFENSENSSNNYGIFGNLKKSYWELLLQRGANLEDKQWAAILEKYTNIYLFKEWENILFNAETKKIHFENLKALFVRYPRAKMRILGPSFDENGNIIGDMEAAETNLFATFANTLQNKFYEELNLINPITAREYKFSTICATEVWLNDIKNVVLVKNLLSREERTLEKEEEYFENVFHVNTNEDVIDSLKRHFPKIVKDISFSENNLKESINNLVGIIREVKDEENKLAQKLEYYKNNYPFITQKIKDF